MPGRARQKYTWASIGRASGLTPALDAGRADAQAAVSTTRKNATTRLLRM
jgi:hypothetical protein